MRLWIINYSLIRHYFTFKICVIWLIEERLVIKVFVIKFFIKFGVVVIVPFCNITFITETALHINMCTKTSIIFLIVGGAIVKLIIQDEINDTIFLKVHNYHHEEIYEKVDYHEYTDFQVKWTNSSSVAYQFLVLALQFVSIYLWLFNKSSSNRLFVNINIRPLIALVPNRWLAKLSNPFLILIKLLHCWKGFGLGIGGRWNVGFLLHELCVVFIHLILLLLCFLYGIYWILVF